MIAFSLKTHTQIKLFFLYSSHFQPNLSILNINNTGQGRWKTQWSCSHQTMARGKGKHLSDINSFSDHIDLSYNHPSSKCSELWNAIFTEQIHIWNQNAKQLYPRNPRHFKTLPLFPIGSPLHYLSTTSTFLNFQWGKPTLSRPAWINLWSETLYSTILFFMHSYIVYTIREPWESLQLCIALLYQPVRGGWGGRGLSEKTIKVLGIR